jgi:mono/diheme cytochrome c family protein
MKRLLLVIASVAFVGCGGKTSQPNFEYLPSLSMMDQKSNKAGEAEPFYADGAAMRVPPQGTLPRGYYPYTKEKFTPAEEAGRGMINPLPKTQEVLARGQKMYNTYCIVCHGVKGKGDGTIIPKFPMPPTLHSEKVRGWPDGAIYHVISAGQNLMPAYASQIDEADRWAIIHYVRALQLAVTQ